MTTRAYVHPGDPYRHALKCTECGCLVVDLQAHENHATAHPDHRLATLERRLQLLEDAYVRSMMEST